MVYLRQKHVIGHYVHIVISAFTIMCLSCCFQRLTCVKSTQLHSKVHNYNYLETKLSNYVFIITSFVCVSFDANGQP